MQTGDSLRRLREAKPLVHQITNYVVMNETANATLALGALPVMAHAREEVEEMAAIAGALVLNIGTLSPDWVEAMLLAGRAANEHGVPVVLDPVGAGATTYRTETAKRLLDEVRVTVLRGNAGEVATLVGVAAEVRGVESIAAADDAAELARDGRAPSSASSPSVTGPVDHVSDGDAVVAVANGHPSDGDRSRAPAACRPRSQAASSRSIASVRSRRPPRRSSRSGSPARTPPAARRARARFTSRCTTRSRRSIPATLDARARTLVRVHALVADLETARRAVAGRRHGRAAAGEGADGGDRRARTPGSPSSASRSSSTTTSRPRSRSGQTACTSARAIPAPARARGRGLLLGRSVTTLAQAQAADADYLGAGPVWETPSKADAGAAARPGGPARDLRRQPAFPWSRSAASTPRTPATASAPGAAGVADDPRGDRSEREEGG